MITDSVVFDRCKRAVKGKTGPVEIRITIDRKSYYFGTGVKILKSEWFAGSVIDRPDADLLNHRIRIVREKVMQEINECLEHDMPIDAEQIRKYVWNTQPGKNDAMLQWMENQINLLRHREGTMRHYATLMLRLRECQIMTRWQDVTMDNLYKFDSWLHELRGRAGRKVGDNTVYNYHKCMKALLSRAVRAGVIQANPYDKLRGAFHRGDRETVEYLTEEELHRIEALELQAGTPLANARDLFVFQAYTGLSYSDAQAFDIKNYRMEDGMLTYIGERIKTGVPYVSRLLPPAVEILTRHGWQVPRMDNSDYNRNLKGIGIAAGIATPLHSHIARHTFATYMLSQGVSLDSVSVMVGHTNVVQTRRYAKTLASTVKNDFDKVAEKMRKAP